MPIETDGLYDEPEPGPTPEERAQKIIGWYVPNSPYHNHKVMVETVAAEIRLAEQAERIKATEKRDRLWLEALGFTDDDHAEALHSDSPSAPTPHDFAKVVIPHHFAKVVREERDREWCEATGVPLDEADLRVVMLIDVRKQERKAARRKALEEAHQAWEKSTDRQWEFGKWLRARAEEET
jgi:hypothetical protein